MSFANPHPDADPRVVQAWITGWTLARETSPPVKVADGFRVDVGWPQQRVRYVFPSYSPELHRLAETIVDPWVFLKVCAAPEDLQPLLPPRWMIQPIGYLMTCAGPMTTARAVVPEGYSLDVMKNLTVPIARVLTSGDDVAAIGRVATVDEFAIYDRIETHPDHRRRGLASAVMSELAALATSRGTSRGVLVATPDGRALYETLGWQVYSPYTTAVIPGPDA